MTSGFETLVQDNLGVLFSLGRTSGLLYLAPPSDCCLLWFVFCELGITNRGQKCGFRRLELRVVVFGLWAVRCGRVRYLFSAFISVVSERRGPGVAILPGSSYS